MKTKAQRTDWKKAEIASECERAGKKDLAALVRSRACPVEVARQLVVLIYGADGFGVTGHGFGVTGHGWGVTGHGWGVKSLQNAIDEHKEDLAAAAGNRKLLAAPGRVYGNVYALGTNGSGRHSSYSAEAVLTECGWCDTYVTAAGTRWLRVWDGRGKNATVKRRFSWDSKAFSHFKPCRPPKYDRQVYRAITKEQAQVVVDTWRAGKWSLPPAEGTTRGCELDRFNNGELVFSSCKSFQKIDNLLMLFDFLEGDYENNIRVVKYWHETDPKTYATKMYAIIKYSNK